MMRYFPSRLILLVIIAAAAGCGGNSNADDDSLPPLERAARFDAFAKQGMSYTELVKAFPPTKFSFGLVDKNDKHIGGTSWTDYTAEKLQREMSSIKFDGFAFQYSWSREPLAYHEANFTKDGKLDHISRHGRFE